LCFTQLLRTSQHSQLISQAALFVTSYSRVDLKRKAFILRNVLESGIGIIKTLKHCRSTLPRIRNSAPFSLRFFSRIRVGGPFFLSLSFSFFLSLSYRRYVTQLTEDEYFTWRCKRTVTKQRTALGAEAMHSALWRSTPATFLALRANSVRMYMRHCNMVLYTVQNILHESQSPFCSANGVYAEKQLVCAVLTRLTYMPAPHCFIWSMFHMFSYRQRWNPKGRSTVFTW